MAIITIPQFLFKVIPITGLAVALTACGAASLGTAGSSTSTASSASSQAVVSSAGVVGSASSLMKSSVSSAASSLSSKSSTSILASSKSSNASYLQGGAIQGASLNVDGVVSTFSGSVYADGLGAAARFNSPNGVVSDGTNLYVTDASNYSIRKIVIATGAVTTLAGGSKGSADGIGAAAGFSSLNGMATDGTNLYVTDNHSIRKIVISTGTVTTLAGGNVGSADGVGTAASFFSPAGIASDGANLYVADTFNHSIRKIVIASGAVSTLAGTARISGSADGVGAVARFTYPYGISTDGSNLYVADSQGYSIRKIVIATGLVMTLAGGTKGNVDGVGVAARFSSPEGVITDNTNLYVTDSSNNSIRKIEIATGAVTTLAGGSEGSVDGAGVAASFNRPRGISTDGANLYVADRGNNSVRKIVIATGAVSTLAGAPSNVDGVGLTATFLHPRGATTDGTNLYVTDSDNNSVRKIVIATGAVTTLAGGSRGSADGVGAVANFYHAEGISNDGINLYVADTSNNTIRKIIIATGAVSTLAGSGFGSADGIGNAASFFGPSGITTDGTSLYVADTLNNSIRKVVIATGAVTTLAGGENFGSADGLGTAASFYGPVGITTDGINLYVADTNNFSIRKIVIATGAVTTLAGGGYGSADGAGVTARFNYPKSITTDGTNLYVTDTSNHSIRKIVIATGVVTTLAGGSSGRADGAGVAASFNSPEGITTDGHSVFVTDTENNTIRKID